MPDFLTDDSWRQTLIGIKQVLKKDGHFIFEVRDPAQKAWLEWTREKTYQRINIPRIGYVEGWCQVSEIVDDIIRFQWTYKFESDGVTLTSDSTLRFRERQAIDSSLRQIGFMVEEVRDAPDRPGKEFVFVASLR